MKHDDKVKAILFIRPNAEFTLSGDELDWQDKTQTEPTKSEIDAGWVAYQAAQKAEAETKALAKSEVIAKLGITEDEAKLLFS